MSRVSLAEAKAHLGALLERVEAGETITIVRRGKDVACLTRPAAARIAFDPKHLRAVTEVMRRQEESAGDFMRRMRDDERY